MAHYHYHLVTDNFSLLYNHYTIYIYTYESLYISFSIIICLFRTLNSMNFLDFFTLSMIYFLGVFDVFSGIFDPNYKIYKKL